MDEIKIKNEILKSFTDNPRDVHTCPTCSRTPKWFFVSVSGRNVIISESKANINSSKLKTNRLLNFNELPEIFKLYLRRKQGESVSREATALTVNQVYWYGIFSELGY